MPFTNRVTLRIVQDGQELANIPFDITGGAEHNVKEDIPANQTNLAMAFALVRAKCKKLVMWATGGQITVKTNSSGSPADTIVLADVEETGKPFAWWEGCDEALDLAADITSLFLTTGADAAVLHIVCLVDPT